MSFDLAVLALGADADPAEMFGRCAAVGDHRRGEPDSRIAAFYGELQKSYPDHGPPAGSPWSSTPLDVGIDHVIVRLRHGTVSDQALELILELAARHRLAVYDPQSGDAYLP